MGKVWRVVEQKLLVRQFAMGRGVCNNKMFLTMRGSRGHEPLFRAGFVAPALGGKHARPPGSVTVAELRAGELTFKGHCMEHKISLYSVVAAMMAFLLLLSAAPAFSFVHEGTFLYVGENDLLPHLRLQEFVSGNMKDFDGSRTHPLVLIFFGADIDTKRERAIEVFNEIQEALPFYRERNVELAAVFVQPEQMSHINDVLVVTHIDFPVYVDIENNSFEKLGVYVMPSILIVGADGIIHKGLGYSHDLDEILPAEIQVMLHEKTREEVNAELKPEVVERSTAQRRARLDYNYALNLVQRHKIDLALEKLEMALKKEPDFVPALVEEGCLLVKKKKFKDAAALLDRGLTLVPGFARALTCKIKLKDAESMKRQGEKAPKKADPSSWGFFADDEAEEGDLPE